VDSVLIFRASSAALIRGRRLFEGGAYLKFGRHKESYILQLLKRASFDCQYLSLAEERSSASCPGKVRPSQHLQNYVL